MLMLQTDREDKKREENPEVYTKLREGQVSQASTSEYDLQKETWGLCSQMEGSPHAGFWVRKSGPITSATVVIIQNTSGSPTAIAMATGCR